VGIHPAEVAAARPGEIGIGRWRKMKKRSGKEIQ
jgi:hypothetical protein